MFILLILIGVIVLASEVEGFYYVKSIRVQTSSGHTGGDSSKTSPRTNPNIISVNTLINYGNNTRIWYNETDVVVGSNFYDQTLRVANGNVVAIYYPTLNAHFVTSINGVRSDGIGSNCSYCWGIWIYCAKDNAWMYSTEGADLVKLSNGDVLAWYIQNISQNNAPLRGAKTILVCSS